ncbi:MAG TPA: nucleotidyltransferase family protein [Prolixibacteraceae bacterium]|nr:nucleotidyltransferase family protein [Prolixibacteraceae bacterium]HPS13268.1 nucleotidyltransferase family protein [Prolixibacteraceae bacterium]
MKAIVFAAGLGTRLKPLTDHCPKALVRLNGQPLLWHTIHFLKKQGIDEVVVNVHHFARMIKEYIETEEFGIPVHISDESDELLDTGGGLLKARQFLEGSEPFVACNVDIITAVDLKKVIEYHKQNRPIATLVVRDRETSRYFLFDEKMELTGWRNRSTGEIINARQALSENQLAFSGIQVISPSIFDLIAEKGKFSVVPLYLRLAKEHKILGYCDTSDFWLDLGKPGQLEIVEKYLSARD